MNGSVTVNLCSSLPGNRPTHLDHEIPLRCRNCSMIVIAINTHACINGPVLPHVSPKVLIKRT
jgi:hypothetical protein